MFSLILFVAIIIYLLLYFILFIGKSEVTSANGSSEKFSFEYPYNNSTKFEISSNLTCAQSNPLICERNRSIVEEKHPDELLPKKIGEFPELTLSLNYLEFCCSFYIRNLSESQSFCEFDCSNISLLPDHSLEVKREGFKPINGPAGGSLFTFSAYLDYRETRLPKNIRFVASKTPYSRYSGEPPTSCHLWTLNYIYVNSSKNSESKISILKLLSSVPAKVNKLVSEEPR